MDAALLTLPAYRFVETAHATEAGMQEYAQHAHEFEAFDLLEIVRRRALEVSLPLGCEVDVMAMGDLILTPWRVVATREPAQGEPQCDVHGGGTRPTILVAHDAWVAYHEGHNLLVATGTTAYRLAPSPHDPDDYPRPFEDC